MHATHYEKFPYQDPNRQTAWCDLELSYLPELNNYLVIATERADNPGMNIINCPAAVAFAVATHYNLPLELLVFLERYVPETLRLSPEAFRMARNLPEGAYEYCTLVHWSDASTDKWRLSGEKIKFVPPVKMAQFREEMARTGRPVPPYDEKKDLARFLSGLGISLPQTD